MRGKVAKPVEIFQIKVTLRDSQPPIWRRIQVRSDSTLAEFHGILQCVMGWEDAHLHQFLIEGERYAMPAKEDPWARQARDERKYKLKDLDLSEDSQFLYTYDFGDNWEHILEIEMALPSEEVARYPRCLAGARVCPPEDVGGISGYENFLQALNDPNHPDHDEYLEWIGGTFDPVAFDLNEVNQRLSKPK